jgi:5,10-methylene-tetrahydrofolate dehydrogenase/methenyl tetrahydrofolate cyclohydrolase
MIIGLSQLISFLFGLYEFITKHCVRKGHTHLLERYAGGNAGSAWAVVTGASDGIGAEYCVLLAKAGFNVALVSRTLDKLKAVEQRCQQEAGANKVQTKII